MYTFSSELEKLSDMLVENFQDDINSMAKKKKNNPSNLHAYFNECMRPSVKYWANHRNLLPIFKKTVIDDENISNLAEEDDEDVDILIIGPTNSGKSQLIKCISDEYSEINDNFYKLTKTLNAEVTPVKFRTKPLKIQEINWSFLKSWHHYYTDAKMVFFVCDISDKSRYSPTLIEVMQLIPKFRKPIA